MALDGEIAYVRDAMIVQLKADADLTAQIPAANIDYGLSKNLVKSLLPKSLRIVSVRIDEDELAEYGAGYQWYWRPYVFNAVVIFALDDTQDEKDGEDYESLYDFVLRKALTKEFSLGGAALKIELGKTFFFTHDEQEKVRMVLLQVTATKLVRSK